MLVNLVFDSACLSISRALLVLGVSEDGLSHTSLTFVTFGLMFTSGKHLPKTLCFVKAMLVVICFKLFTELVYEQECALVLQQLTADCFEEICRQRGKTKTKQQRLMTERLFVDCWDI